MRVTAICNLKGGVAKSTTVINLGAILARDYGKRVLLIDADCQCNTTVFFGGDPAKGNIARVLREASKSKDPGAYAAIEIQSTATAGVDLLAADDSLMDLDLTKAENGTADAAVLKKLVWAVQGMYDVVLIDCPPAFNAASAAALIAADDVVLPIKMDAFTLQGMGNMMRQISNMRQLNPKLQIAGVLPTMWYKDDLMADSEAQLAKAGLRIYPHIRYSRPVDKMTFTQQPLCISSPRSGAGLDYRRFAAAYVEEGKSYGL